MRMGAMGRRGLYLRRSSCFGTLLAVMRTLTLPVVQVAVIVLVIAAAVIVWWLMSRRRRFGTVDVADLFEVVEVGISTPNKARRRRCARFHAPHRSAT